VTIIHPDGRDMADIAEQWRVDALYTWLSDEKIQRMVTQRGLMSAQRLRMIGVVLGKNLEANKGRPPEDRKQLVASKELKLAMYILLRDRTVRRRIAVLVLAGEAENHRAEHSEFERLMDAWAIDTQIWLDSNEAGPRPVRPKRPTTMMRKLADIRAELQREHVELQAWFQEAEAKRTLTTPRGRESAGGIILP